MPNAEREAWLEWPLGHLTQRHALSGLRPERASLSTNQLVEGCHAGAIIASYNTVTKREKLVQRRITNRREGGRSFHPVDQSSMVGEEGEKISSSYVVW